MSQARQKLYEFRNNFKKGAVTILKQRFFEDSCFGDGQRELAEWLLEDAKYVFQKEKHVRRREIARLKSADSRTSAKENVSKRHADQRALLLLHDDRRCDANQRPPRHQGPSEGCADSYSDRGAS